MNTYRISSLKDVFDLPSIEHIKNCMEELTMLMVQVKALKQMADAIGQAQGVESGMEWPQYVDWLDDGIKEATVVVTSEGEEVLTMVGRK